MSGRWLLPPPLCSTHGVDRKWLGIWLHRSCCRARLLDLAPSGDSYVKNILTPAGVRPRILRSSRMLALLNSTDPKLVATAYGMTYDGVTAYLADRIDPTRLPDL